MGASMKRPSAPAAKIVVAVLVLGVLLAAGFGCGRQSAASSEGSKLGPIPTALIEYDFPHMTIADWTKDSDLIVAGTVVKIDAPRWNSADGKRWSQHSWDEDSEPLVYQTFYVQPEEILHGAPKWGTPVAFRAVWWNSPTGGGPVAGGRHGRRFRHAGAGVVRAKACISQRMPTGWYRRRIRCG